jgi:hypothetical protein
MTRQQESVFFVDALGAFFMWVLVKPWLFQQEVVASLIDCWLLKEILKESIFCDLPVLYIWINSIIDMFGPFELTKKCGAEQ